ncbi:hypothetical protein AMECASPLE_036586 [Ameca splendens]|uniref:Uncharacterized protein n=1 Tax=Ameca splendens TaxID=208324 RepID=A0ABV0Y7J9_9TELE
MMQQKIQNKSRDGHGSRCKHHLEKWTGRNEKAQKTEGNRFCRELKRLKVGVKIKDQRDSLFEGQQAEQQGDWNSFTIFGAFPNTPPTRQTLQSSPLLPLFLLASMPFADKQHNQYVHSVGVLCCRTQQC